MDEEKIEPNNDITQNKDSVKTKKTTKSIFPSWLSKYSFMIGYTFFFLITAAGVLFKITSQNQVETSVQQPTKSTVQTQTLVRRSKILNIIVKAETAKSIDLKTGKVITAARVFSINDKTIYLALDLNNPSLGTRIDYIRYLNGKYIDHGSVLIGKSAMNNIVFDWTINGSVINRPSGKYKIATYSNGVLEKRLSYDVVKNKVTYVYPDDSFNQFDKEYLLKDISLN